MSARSMCGIGVWAAVIDLGKWFLMLQDKQSAAQCFVEKCQHVDL